MSQEDAEQFITKNTTDRRALDAATRARRIDRDAAPVLCPLCGEDTRLPGKRTGDPEHFKKHSGFLGKSRGRKKG